MIDLKFIRENPEKFDEAMKSRGVNYSAAEIILLDEKKRKKTFAIQELQASRNQIAKEIAAIKKAGGNADQLLAKSRQINDQLAKIEAENDRTSPSSNNEGPSEKSRFFEEFLGSQICEKASVARSCATQANLDNDTRAKRLHSLRKIKKFANKIAKKDGFSEGPDQDELESLLLNIPNLPCPSVPFGRDENDNQIVEIFGKPKSFDFKPKAHDELGLNLEMLDFEQSALMSGARFSTLSSDLARLERALSNFMLDIASENGYLEISPPNLVKSQAMQFSGQLPKFSEEAFCTADGYWLIPTSEVSLVNLVAKKILNENQLPLRFTAFTPCFRREAGSAGKDTRGIIRQHQFKKVELVSITKPQDSDIEHERMTATACEVLKRLELPFRKILLCSGDMGFCAQKTYDLEVWLPSQEKYREISSCSNCGDFQARRASIRFKNDDGKNLFVHTLNGSSLAVGRTLVAILENYQNENGSIAVPQALQSYFGGQKLIKSK